MSEPTPAEYGGTRPRYRKLERDCDDPAMNFMKIRNRALWEDMESRRKQEAENAKVASKFKPK